MTVTEIASLVGGVLELIGAGILVVRSFAARRRIKDLRLTFDEIHKLMIELKTNTERQAADLATGFAFLAAGLLLQLWGPIVGLFH